MALRVDDVDLVRDRALVERFQEGDPAAFETLYSRYFARLARFCQKRVGDPLEAEEIAQEAFTRALRALPTFKGERRFYPWMTVIAGRLCVDSHRRRGRTEPSCSVDLGVIEGGQEQIVDDVDIKILAQALVRLAPRHRDVLDLREQQGWSYQQIADHYGVTLGTVEALLFRARKALKREFMAVVGGDRNWAGVPILGAAFAKVGLAKAKVDAWIAALAPSLGGPALAAALAVTAVTGVVGGVAIHNHHPSERSTSAVRLDHPTLTAAATTTAAHALVPGISTEPSLPVGTEPARPTRDDAGVAAPTPTGLTVSSYNESSETAAEDPVRVEPVPGLFGTWKPEQPVTDVTNSASRYADQLGEEKP